MDNTIDETKRASLPPDFMTNNEYFMGIAHLASKRSMDPVRRVGACIVNKNNQIVGVGYNAMPGDSADPELWRNKKYNVWHAEKNAILNTNSADLEDCTIYQTLFPCNDCADRNIKSGIKRIIYSSDEKSHKRKTKESKKLLLHNNIIFQKFKHDNISKVEIDLHAGPSDIPKTKQDCINQAEIDLDAGPSTPKKSQKGRVNFVHENK